MKAYVTLILDLEVTNIVPFFFGLFKRNEPLFAKATYFGELNLKDLKVGDTLPLYITNQSIPTAFLIRFIDRLPSTSTTEAVTKIALYDRICLSFTSVKGVMRKGTISEAVKVLGLGGQICENLAHNYNFRLVENSCGVGEPTFDSERPYGVNIDRHNSY